MLFDARWHADGVARERELVLRIAPTGYQVFPDDTFLRQHAVLRALAERTDVPVPAVHWLDEDPRWFGAPFWIVDRVAGDIPTDRPPYAATGWLHDAAAVDQERAWWSGVDAMAAVHRVDLDALALPPGTFPVGADTLDWQLDACAAFLEWAEDGTPFALARDALHQLRDARPPDPPEGPCLVWGDARLSNLVYRDFEVVGVLDWEMAALGDPLLDLGWWLFADDALTRGAGLERLPGFPFRDATAQRWSAAAGRSIDPLDWFERFAALRFTVIMLRMGKLLLGMGVVPPSFPHDNLISAALEELLAKT